MAPPTTTGTRTTRSVSILALLLGPVLGVTTAGAVPAGAQPDAAASDQAPPPASCITDAPVDPSAPVIASNGAGSPRSTCPVPR
jgi:hypothetical protein